MRCVSTDNCSSGRQQRLVEQQRELHRPHVRGRVGRDLVHPLGVPSSRLMVTAKRRGDGYVLSGRKAYCAGGNVAIMDMNEELGKSLVRELGSDRTKFFLTDVADSDSVTAAVKGTMDWTPEEIALLFPSTFGMDLVNPAPPRD